MKEALIQEFKNLVEIDKRISEVMPKTSPYVSLLGQKMLDLMLHIRFVIDVETAEKENPVQLGLSQKPKLEAADNGAN